MKARWSRCYHLVALSMCCMHGSALVLVPKTNHVNTEKFCRSSVVCHEGKSNDNNDEYEQVDPDSVTDAEALLACRAYLQRKNRLGAWKDYQRRKESLRKASADVGSTQESESVGFFWENPEELIYLHQNKDDTIEQDDDEVGSEESGRVVYENIEQDGTIRLGTTPSALEEGAEFTLFPTMPSEETVRRSKAAKKMWSDPQWKEMWYAKRWGRLRNTSPLLAKQKRLDDRMRAVPPNLFESEQLASLTDEEITEAIRTYVVSNRKRSKAQTKERRQEKRKQVEREMAERHSKKEHESKLDMFVEGSSDAMKETQRKRSERAAKAYQTRLANQDKQRKSTTTRNRHRSSVVPPDALPTSDTPKDALMRVQARLESNQLPSIDDIRLILKPPKLGRRKDLLRRILNEHFDLRGKCVPSHSSSDDSELLFVTQCSICELGNFVLEKMQERLDKQSSQ